MRPAVVFAGVAATLAAAAPLAARAPLYAHKAGIDTATYDADETACFTDAQKAMNDPKFMPPYTVNPVTQGTMGGSMGSALGYGLAAGIMSGKRFSTTLYDCLISKGYTMRRVSDEDWKSLRKLRPPERQERMRPWRTAPEPVHAAVTRDEID